MSTGERIRVDVKDEIFVFNVTRENGEEDVITLRTCCPSMMSFQTRTSRRSKNSRMCATNWTEIGNLGWKMTTFTDRLSHTLSSYSRRIWTFIFDVRQLHEHKVHAINPKLGISCGWGDEEVKIYDEDQRYER